MKGGCISNRVCEDCPYNDMCGGCIGTACIHNREKQGESKCLFCDLHGLDCRPTPEPSKSFQLARPEILLDSVDIFLEADLPDSPKQLSLPSLIPEVSYISPTTARLGLYDDEGDWTIPFYNPIAWDMTGNLFLPFRFLSLVKALPQPVHVY